MEIRKYFRLTFLLFIFSTTCFVSSVLSVELTRNHMDSLPGCAGDCWGGWSYDQPNHLTILTSDSPDGGNMIRYTLPAGSTAGDPGHIGFRGPTNTSYPEVYIQFYHKYSSNFVGNHGGNKILYIYPASAGSSPLFEWHPESDDPLTGGAAIMQQIWGPGDVEHLGYTNTITYQGTWYKYKFHLVANSSGGVADGILQIWIDDVLKTNMSDMVYFKTGQTVTGWMQFVLQGYYGGGAGAPTAEESYMYFDDAIISTTPIGTSFKPSSIPGSPINLKIQ